MPLLYLFPADIMRKSDLTQHALYSYRTLEQPVPEAHLLRVLVDGILQSKSAEFASQVPRIAEWQDLNSNEYLTVDGTQIDAWASVKCFVKKDGSSSSPDDGGRNPTVDFKGEQRSNETHQSTTGPDARLYKKSEGDKSRLSYLSHARMENRSGLVLDAETTLATGTASATQRWRWPGAWRRFLAAFVGWMGQKSAR